jgi:hypothetical protein
VFVQFQHGLVISQHALMFLISFHNHESFDVTSVVTKLSKYKIDTEILI